LTFLRLSLPRSPRFVRCPALPAGILFIKLHAGVAPVGNKIELNPNVSYNLKEPARE
jgi:hypothetical protein